jgi:hypothetical protein
MFNRITKQGTLPASFCFFIDGLDEYNKQKNDTDLVDFLKYLARYQSIKLYISNRPWNQFVSAFGESNYKLILEDLTKDDLRIYVHSMLVENDTFVKLSKQHDRYNTFVPRIAEKAHGVWL